jgi:hypothetical protein
MSFLDKNNSEYLSARITQKGRNSIAKGDFNIKFFNIGDSEFVYSNPFSNIKSSVTNGFTHQGVFAPLDKDNELKYPFLYEPDSTIFGIPITGSTTEVIRNVMGPAGFVSNYVEYDGTTGTTIQCLSNSIDFSEISGSTILNITKATGTTYTANEYITLAFNSFDVNGDIKYISGATNGLIYKVLGVTGATSGTTQSLTLDRKTPDLSSITGYGNVISNKCELEIDLTNTSETCIPILPDSEEQHNPWSLNVVWGIKPIGSDVSSTDENLSGYTSNKYISTKEYLGYGSTGQTFINYTGGTIDPTTYKNSFNETITLKEQKCLAIIHFSEVGDIPNNTDRFFTYDDYISGKIGISGEDISIIDDINGDPISDNDYFEVYIPFISYHRNTGTTIGAKFVMGEDDFYVKSIYNEKSKIKFRYLLDESNNKVGKVFVDKKIIVFDDEELVAILDYRSNRKYTLPAPKLSILHSDDSTSLINSTGQTFWVTYLLKFDSDGELNSLPCNYYSKIDGITTPSNIGVKFGNEFTTILNTLDGFIGGLTADTFHILIQETIDGDSPIPDNWLYMDFTTEAGGSTLSSLTGTTFIINESKYNSGTLFDLENHFSSLSSNYLGDQSSNDVTNLSPQFGDEQPFPGSIRLVRATDIEEMKFLINLPDGKFTTSQNPTKNDNLSMNPMITEISLLDANKDTLVIAKTSKPIPRVGTQVFAVKLDF